MPDFGIRPKVGRIFVRLQEIDASGKVLRTQSMNVWGATWENVLGVVQDALIEEFGNDEVPAPPPAPVKPPVKPIKAKIGKGQRA